MPVRVSDNIIRDAGDSIFSGSAVVICPTQSHINFVSKALLAKNKNILWGNIFFTPQTLISEHSDPGIEPISELAKTCLIINTLKKSHLKYFEMVKGEDSIIDEFANAITLLRKNLIYSKQLESDLDRRGSLKEYDLLVVYKRYEEELARLGHGDSGSLLENLLTRLSTKGISPFQNSGTVIFDGFEPLTPDILNILAVCQKTYPEKTILIGQYDVPLHPIYEKFYNLSTKAMHNFYNYAPKTSEEDRWRLEIEPTLHIFNSTGDEARFIAEEISKVVMKKDKLAGLAISRNPDSIAQLAHSLKEKNIVPRDAATDVRGILSTLKKVIENSDNLASLTNELEKISLLLKSAFREGRHLPQISGNLSHINSLFKDIFALQNIKNGGVDLAAIKKLLIKNISINPLKMADFEKWPFSIFWLEDSVTGQTDELFIPALSQSAFAEAQGSIFFQETGFLPGNAPDYFALVFPQQDMIRAKNIYKFRKLLQSTRSAHLSYSRITIDGKETYPSNIITLFDSREVEEPRRLHTLNAGQDLKKRLIAIVENELAGSNRSGDENFFAVNDKEVRADIRARFLDHIYSASQLETYAKCPYQYYLKKVLALDPIETPTPEINPKHRGTIIHRMMELFFQNEIKNVLRFIRNEIKWEVLEERIDQYIKTALEENRTLVMDLHPSIVGQFLKRARVAVVEAARLEIKYICEMRYPLLPHYTEWEFGGEEARYLAINDGTLEKDGLLAGVIDRIDIDPEHGTFAITDYKTGATESILSKIPRGEHLQLPIYIFAVKKLLLKDLRPVGAFLFSLKKLEKKHGLALKDDRAFYFPKFNPKLFVDQNKWDELLDSAFKTAVGFIAKIRAAAFPVNTESCRQFCDFNEVCRYEKD